MPLTLGISTGGGDAPGLNAVIEAVTVAASRRNWAVVGIRDGLDGVLYPERYPEGGLVELTPSSVRGIACLGGTVIGAASGGDPVPDDAAALRAADLVGQAGIDALILVGGDGTQKIADRLARHKVRVVGAPKTIDNDLVGTVSTFGFDTAVGFATDCLSRLRATADSHRRVMVVEMMGRDAGWIALHSALAGEADAALIPEIPYVLDELAEFIRSSRHDRVRSHLVVVAEGAVPAGTTGMRPVGADGRLSGAGDEVAAGLRARGVDQVRSVNLGHLLRGGQPDAADRLLGLRLGAAAVRMVESNIFSVMVSWDGVKVTAVPLSEVAGRIKRVPLDGDAVRTARDLGLFLGTSHL